MWTDHLKINPISLLMASEEESLHYFTERDLLDSDPGNVEKLWEIGVTQKIISKQQEDGSWRYKGNRPGDELGENYELLETWKILRNLVEMFGFNRNHPAASKAAEFIFSCQTSEGDIRGILSNQYTPYYMGAIMETLIKAGYGDDARIEKGFKWLLDMRQDDGGWIIPMQMFKMQEFYTLYNEAPIPPEKERPFSHMASGMVIRAFAAHDKWRKSDAAINAGMLLKGRFFKKDVYTSRQAVGYWYKLQFPFWWTNILTVLDSLMRMEFSKEDIDIRKAVDWLIEHQEPSGIWRTSYGGVKEVDQPLWLTLVVCRVLKYFFS